MLIFLKDDRRINRSKKCGILIEIVMQVFSPTLVDLERVLGRTLGGRNPRIGMKLSSERERGDRAFLFVNLHES